MKRGWTGALVGAALLALAVPAMAQQPAFTVTFSGEMRVHGIWWDNVTDWRDTSDSTCFAATGGRPSCKDSEAYFFQRWRLWTTVQSADKKAKAVWAVEVGDVTWGSGGGASGAEFGGTTARVGPSTGGGLGADGVNVETKHLYVQFDIPGVPNANLLLGAHNILLLTSPTLAFLDDDAWGIQFNWKMDPVDLQIWYAKTDENARANADDNDMYAARLGVNVTKDLRVTLEGLVMNQQCFARRADTTCVSSDFGETFWVGGTVGAKVGTVDLHGTVVYGQRQLFSAARSANVEEAGWGVSLSARVPVGPLTVWAHGWWTSGDENRPVGGNCNLVTNSPLCGSAALRAAGMDIAAQANTTNLTTDSDKLPVVIRGTSWASAPFVAEFFTGLRTLGAPAFGSPQYLDLTGTWGVGGSVIYALTPALSLGGGVAFFGPSEDARNPGGFVGELVKDSLFGQWALELDAGLTYTYNPNLSFQFIAGYLTPDKGDDAWGASFRTRFAF